MGEATTEMPAEETSGAPPLSVGGEGGDGFNVKPVAPQEPENISNGEAKVVEDQPAGKVVMEHETQGEHTEADASNTDKRSNGDMPANGDPNPSSGEQLVATNASVRNGEVEAAKEESAEQPPEATHAVPTQSEDNVGEVDMDIDQSDAPAAASIEKKDETQEEPSKEEAPATASIEPSAPSAPAAVEEGGSEDMDIDEGAELKPEAAVETPAEPATEIQPTEGGLPTEGGENDGGATANGEPEAEVPPENIEDNWVEVKKEDAEGFEEAGDGERPADSASLPDVKAEEKEEEKVKLPVFPDVPYKEVSASPCGTGTAIIIPHKKRWSGWGEEKWGDAVKVVPKKPRLSKPGTTNKTPAQINREALLAARRQCDAAKKARQRAREERQQREREREERERAELMAKRKAAATPVDRDVFVRGIKVGYGTHVPRVGQVVMFLRQGYSQHLNQIIDSPLVVEKVQAPWKTRPTMRAVEECRVTAMRCYLDPEQPYCAVDLERKQGGAGGGGAYSFSIIYQPNNGLPDFIINKGRFQSAINRNWKKGDRFRMYFDSEDSNNPLQWFNGTIIETEGDDERFPESPWERLLVEWDSNVGEDDSCERVSPWELDEVPDESEDSGDSDDEGRRRGRGGRSGRADASSSGPKGSRAWRRGMNEQFCAVCEGTTGAMVNCDGPCLRSFHVKCSNIQRVNKDEEWYCDNCQQGRHKCFLCNRWCSMKDDAVRCSKNCGKFYHYGCAKKAERGRFISSGKAAGLYICPLHKCPRCKKKAPLSQSVRCIKCPLVYHQKCVPNNAEIIKDKKYIICARHVKKDPKEEKRLTKEEKHVPKKEEPKPPVAAQPQVQPPPKVEEKVEQPPASPVKVAAVSSEGVTSPVGSGAVPQDEKVQAEAPVAEVREEPAAELSESRKMKREDDDNEGPQRKKARPADVHTSPPASPVDDDSDSDDSSEDESDDSSDEEEVMEDAAPTSEHPITVLPGPVAMKEMLSTVIGQYKEKFGSPPTFVHISAETWRLRSSLRKLSGEAFKIPKFDKLREGVKSRLERPPFVKAAGDCWDENRVTSPRTPRDKEKQARVKKSAEKAQEKAKESSQKEGKSGGNASAHSRHDHKKSARERAEERMLAQILELSRQER